MLQRLKYKLYQLIKDLSRWRDTELTDFVGKLITKALFSLFPLHYHFWLVLLFLDGRGVYKLLSVRNSTVSSETIVDAGNQNSVIERGKHNLYHYFYIFPNNEDLVYNIAVSE